MVRAGECAGLVPLEESRSPKGCYHLICTFARWRQSMKFLLPATVFLCVFLVHFVMHEFPSLPDRLQYLPDVPIAGVCAIVIGRLVATGRLSQIPLRYWIVFLCFLYVVVSGLILNEVSPGVVVGGIRFYFKYIPLFLLPFAFDYSPADAKRIFKMLSVLALIQIPLALRQRFSEYSGIVSGDVITGSLGSSTSLSLFAIGMIVYVVALFVDKRISLMRAVALGLLFILPATVNETKVTPIALALGTAGVLFARRHTVNSRQLVLVSVAGVVLLGAFVLAYDYLYRTPGGAGYIDFMSNKESVIDNYMLRGVGAKPFAIARDEDRKFVAKPVLKDKETWIGRFDAVRMPFTTLRSSDGVRFLLGLGLGNVSSTFGDGAHYIDLKFELGAMASTLSQLLWETGLLGAAFAILLLCMVASDSLALSSRDSPFAALAASWFGISLIILATLAYTNLILMPEITCLIAFLSGMVVVKSSGKRFDEPVRLVHRRPAGPALLARAVHQGRGASPRSNSL